MDAKTRVERQETRVWAIEQLLRQEGFLDPRMYECADYYACLLYTSPSPRDRTRSRMPSSA